MANKGVVYYKIESEYSGDITKYCGLSGGEIDGNFLFLRGSDIESGEFNKEEGKLALKKLNGDVIIIDNFVINNDEPILDINNSFYDKNRGVLVLTIGGISYELNGFYVYDETKIKVYSGANLNGDGSITNPLTVSDTLKTGMFAPSISFIDLTDENNTLPLDPKVGDRYLTKEGLSDYGLLYNFDGVKKVSELLRDEASKWRVPTNTEWAEMLNALELCEDDMTHDGKQSNKYYGKIAGAYLKNDVFTWDSVGVKNESLENSIKPINNNLPEASYLEYVETIVNGKTYEVSGVTEDGSLFFEQYVCTTPWEKYDGDDATHFSALTKSYGFKALPAGTSDFSDENVVRNFGRMTGFWSIDQDNETDAWVRILQYNKDGVRLQGEALDGFYSLRLVRDYEDGIDDIEFITNNPYSTVLMPYVKIDDNGSVIETGNKVWTQQNVTFNSLLNRSKNDGVVALKVLDKNSNVVTSKEVYFINYWNGKSWEKSVFANNCSMVLEYGPNGVKNEEWQLVDNELVRRSSEIIKENKAYVDSEIDRVTEKHDNEVSELHALVSSNTEKISEEITIREQSFELLNITLNDEIAKRELTDDRLAEEILVRENTVSELHEQLSNEAEKRKVFDEQLSTKLTVVENELLLEAKERVANELIIPSSDFVISVTEGASLKTNGNSEVGVDVKTLQFRIDANFGELE